MKFQSIFEGAQGAEGQDLFVNFRILLIPPRLHLRNVRHFPSHLWDPGYAQIEAEQVDGHPPKTSRHRYHEAGHALMGAMVPDYDLVTKVTIVPRSNGAGGFTLFTPTEERLDSGMYSQRSSRIS